MLRGQSRSKSCGWAKNLPAGKLAKVGGLLMVVGALISGLPGNADAATVTLSWDISSEVGVAGYRIYCGGVSGVYTNVATASGTNAVTLTGLRPGITYYFAASTISTLGFESALSEEIKYMPIAVGPGPLTLRIQMDSSRRAVLSGSGPASTKYDVQTSQNLTQWTVLGQVTTDASGAFQYTDQGSVTNNNRSYRLKQYVGAPGRATLQLQLNQSRQAQLTGTGPAGYIYAVQATPDLRNWGLLGYVTVGSDGKFSFDDPDSARNTNRSYRLQQAWP